MSCQKYGGELSGSGIEPRSHLFHVIWTTSFSMSLRALLQKAQAIIVILFLVSKETGNEASQQQD